MWLAKAMQWLTILVLTHVVNSAAVGIIGGGIPASGAKSGNKEVINKGGNEYHEESIGHGANNHGTGKPGYAYGHIDRGCHPACHDEKDNVVDEEKEDRS